MGGDQYTALWISYSSLCDFDACPRAYYLKNVYKDPQTKKKIKLVSPPLSLGSALHEALEPLAQLPVEERFKMPLQTRFESSWKSVEGKRGGFFNSETQEQYKNRGKDMIARVQNHPGPFLNKAIKLPKELPQMWLSEKENIILCGKIDWMEYIPETDSVHIIDFKTGKNEEEVGSLQLPIYYLLATAMQRRRVTKMSYWYLDKDDEPVNQSIPNRDESVERIMRSALQIKLARELKIFKCPHGEAGCRACQGYEAILAGNAEQVGVEDRSLLFAIDPSRQLNTEESVIH